MNKEIIERIHCVDWLAACGQPVLDVFFGFEFEQVFDWGIAEKLYKDVEWENSTLAMSNNLSDYVRRKSPKDYDQWNSLAKDAKRFFDLELRDTLQKKAAVFSQSKGLVDSVEWDVIGFIVEEHFKRLDPPVFFNKIFLIYEAGHFPCGINGCWPEGSIILI